MLNLLLLNPFSVFCQFVPIPVSHCKEHGNPSQHSSSLPNVAPRAGHGRDDGESESTQILLVDLSLALSTELAD